MKIFGLKEYYFSFSILDISQGHFENKTPSLLSLPLAQSIFFLGAWQFSSETLFLRTRPSQSRLGSLLPVWGCPTLGMISQQSPRKGPVHMLSDSVSPSQVSDWQFFLVLRKFSDPSHSAATSSGPPLRGSTKMGSRGVRGTIQM